MKRRCKKPLIRLYSFFITILFAVLFSFSLIAHTAASQQNSLAPAQTDKQVHLTVTVTDKRDRLISNLSQNSFTILDDGKPQEITAFNNKDVPLSIGIIFDTSNSMITRDPKQIAIAKEGLVRFLRLGNELNEYFVMGFEQQPQLVVDWTRDVATVIKALDAFAPKQSHKGTALFDACYVAIEKIMQGTHPKRVILLVTDGQDNNSRHKYPELRYFLQESGVMVYAVGLFDPDALKSIGQGVLNEISHLSGGMAVYPTDKSSMLATFESIAFELKQQYLIGFRSSAATDSSKLRKIKVEVKAVVIGQSSLPDKLEGLKARTQLGYYITRSQ